MTERPSSRWNQPGGWAPPTVPVPPERDRLERVGDFLRRMPKGGWIGLAVVAFFVIPAISSGVGSEDEPATEDRQYAAFDICTEFVKDRLKSPGSASFRNYFEDDGEVMVSGSGNGPYTVRSTVDAQNGFGADIRSDFVCVVTLDGETWRLQDITIDQ